MEISLIGLIGIKQCPSSGTVPWTCGAPAALSGTPFGIDKRAQVVEPIGGNHSSGNQFPESRFDLGLQFVRASDDVGEERVRKWRPRCLVPAFDGASLSSDSKDALWAKFYMEAPRRQRRSVERYSIVKRA